MGYCKDSRLHKNSSLSADVPETNVKAGDRFTTRLYKRLLAEEFDKLLKASKRDVHDF